MLRSRTFLVAALSLPALLAGAAPASSTEAPTHTPEERAAALARPAVVFFLSQWKGYVFDENNRQINAKAYELGFRCTGFVVNPSGYVVTAGHCVDDTVKSGVSRDFLELAVEAVAEAQGLSQSDANALFRHAIGYWRVEGNNAGSKPERVFYIQFGTANGGAKAAEGLPARVVDWKPIDEGDVALLKIERADLPSIEIAETSEIAIGTPVLSIGYPGSTDQVTDFSYEPTNKDGKVSAKKTTGTLPVYEISAALSGGMSGGPTVNLDGKVVGLNSFGIVGESQAFNFLQASSTISETLRRNGVENKLAPTDLTYRAGLEKYFAGRYADSIKDFDQVLELAPTNRQAQDFKLLAAKARNEGKDVADKDDGGFPVLPVAIGVVVLLALLGGGLTMRRKRSPEAAKPIRATATAGRPVGSGDEPTVIEATKMAAVVAGAVAGGNGRFCESCGADRSPGKAFCGSCGARF